MIFAVVASYGPALDAYLAFIMDGSMSAPKTPSENRAISILIFLMKVAGLKSLFTPNSLVAMFHRRHLIYLNISGSLASFSWLYYL